MLSRLPSVETIDVTNLLGFETTEFESKEYLELVKVIESNSEKLPDLKIENGVIYKKMTFDPLRGESQWRLWIPDNITQPVIESAHAKPTASHGGVAKTLERLKRFFYWPKMATQVKNFIASCQTCKETKPCNLNLRPGIGKQVVTERPFQKLYVDFMGKYPRSKKGNSYIFIVVDHFTKFTFLKAMKEATATNIINFLVKEIFHKFGVPEVIHSDNGSQFCSKNFENLLESYKIQHVKTAVYSPQSNASERVNQSVLSAIRAYLEKDHRDWDMYLSEIECALRTSVHTATGVTPFFALFGYHMYSSGADYILGRKLQSLTDHEILQLNGNDKMEILREKIKENMKQAYNRSAKRYNRGAREIKFAPGQEVYRRNSILSSFGKNINSKFCRKFLKCRIVKPVGNKIYELETLQGKSLGTYHAKDIRI